MDCGIYALSHTFGNRLIDFLSIWLTATDWHIQSIWLRTARQLWRWPRHILARFIAFISGTHQSSPSVLPCGTLPNNQFDWGPSDMLHEDAKYLPVCAITTSNVWHLSCIYHVMAILPCTHPLSSSSVLICTNTPINLSKTCCKFIPHAFQIWNIFSSNFVWKDCALIIRHAMRTLIYGTCIDGMCLV